MEVSKVSAETRLSTAQQQFESPGEILNEAKLTLSKTALGSLLDFIYLFHLASPSMPRQLRLEYQDALYHMTARENGRQACLS